MPTYKNNRAGAIILTAFVGLEARTINADAQFVAHPSEVPESWLNTKDDKSGKMIVEKVSDSPVVAAPERPVLSTPASLDAMRAEDKRESLEMEMELERMKQETERLKKANLDAAAAQAAADAAESAKATAKPAKEPAAKPADSKPAEAKPADPK